MSESTWGESPASRPGQHPVYLDNAATSWPKPPSVIEAVCRFLSEVGANPGRSGHRRSVEAARVVFRARQAATRLLGLGDPLRVVVCANATEALNLAVRGLLRPGRHVVATSMEHNSVMRPLGALETEGTALTVVRCSPQGVLDPADVERAIRPETTMIVATHASSVLGTILPVPQLAAIAREHDLLLLVDAAQPLGCLPFSLAESCTPSRRRLRPWTCSSCSTTG
jgi:selenocysteine lyase/cysteine desulfurase